MTLKNKMQIGGLAPFRGAVRAAFLCSALIVMPVTAQAQSTNAKARPAPANSATAALRTRVQQLEGQLLDMQVIIGTLQSLARSGGGRGAAAVAGPVLNSAAGDDSRIRFLETQIQALTAQVERLSRQVRGGQRGDAGDGTAPRGRLANERGENGASSTGDFRTSTAPGSAITGFGATTVTPGGGDSIGRLLERDRGIAAGDTMKVARAGGDPKQLYETAYGYLLQQNFKNAQSSFAQFLQLYPENPLAGNAQYWLGETYYVRRKYRAAANAFLKGYQNYGRSNKAPDNLLKLSMSLERLGQKEAACSSYLELQKKFPRAPAHVAKKAQAEIQRLSC